MHANVARALALCHPKHAIHWSTQYFRLLCHPRSRGIKHLVPRGLSEDCFNGGILRSHALLLLKNTGSVWPVCIHQCPFPSCTSSRTLGNGRVGGIGTEICTAVIYMRNTLINFCRCRWSSGGVESCPVCCSAHECTINYSKVCTIGCTLDGTLLHCCWPFCTLNATWCALPH
jgi:hypothetical protein